MIPIRQDHLKDSKIYAEPGQGKPDKCDKSSVSAWVDPNGSSSRLVSFTGLL